MKKFKFFTFSLVGCAAVAFLFWFFGHGLLIPRVSDPIFSLQVLPYIMGWPFFVLSFDSLFSKDGGIVVLILGFLGSLASAGFYFFERLWGRALILLALLLWFAIGTLMTAAMVSASI